MDNEMPPGSPPPEPSKPPLITPPPLVSQPPAPGRKRRGGLGWMLLSFFLIACIGLFAAVKIVKSLAGAVKRTAHVDGRLLEEHLVENNHSHNKIAVIDIDGIIMDRVDEWTGASLVSFLKDQLHVAGEDDNVKAVVLRVDSPGGEVLAADDIAREIAKFQKDNDKPVIVSMGSLAASGGYYISAPCRWIVANELTITGSIGVIMQSYNYRGLMNKVGIKPETFKSGKFKDMLSGEKEPSEITDEERAMIQALITETFEKFKSVVANGRKAASDQNKSQGRPLSADWKNFADGRVFSGRQAYDLGFVDELGGFDTAVDRAKALGGVKDANLVQYRMPMTFGNLFRLFGKAHVPAMAINVDLGLDLPKLQAGKMYFLSSTVLR